MATFSLRWAFEQFEEDCRRRYIARAKASPRKLKKRLLKRDKKERGLTFRQREKAQGYNVLNYAHFRGWSPESIRRFSWIRAKKLGVTAS